MAPLEVSMHVAARALQTAPLRTAAMQERWTWGRSKVSGSCSPPPREVSIQYPLWRPGNCVFYLQEKKKKKKIAFLRIGAPDRRNVNSKLFPEVSVNVRGRMDASRPMFIHLQLLFDVSTHRGCLLLTLTQVYACAQELLSVALQKGFAKPPLSHLFPTPPSWCGKTLFSSGFPHVFLFHTPFIQGSLVDSIPAATVKGLTVPWMSLPRCQCLSQWFPKVVGRSLFKVLANDLVMIFLAFTGL